MIRLYLLLIVLGVLGGAGYGAYSYYTSTQARIQQLVENNAKLETAYESQKAAVETLQANAEQQAILNKELMSKLEQAEKYQDDLRAKLQKHDLTRLSASKPGLIEKRINDATKKLFDELESDTAKQ